MIIYNNVGNKVLEIEVDDNSYRNRAVMGDHSLTLYYSLPEHVEIPVGSYCEFQGETFTLKRPENFKMKHKRLFEYTVLFDPPEANAKVWKFRNPVDGRLKFSLTAKPHEHLQMFVDNMNRRDKGWTVGECIDGVETLIAYDHDFCIDALTRMASTFKTEYEFTGKRVSLRKIEYNKSNPLPLSYGRGNGFKPGVGRSNTGDNPPTEILFVQGGTDNIDPSKYGSSELLLPKNQTLAYDGEHFEDEDGFIAKNARRYVVDEAGLSIRRDDKQLSSLAEDSLDCSEIYPKRVGTVSTVVAVDEKNNFYDIVDTSIPSSLNYEECLIAGETMTVVFQTGMLAGREFEVKYYHNAVKGKAARRFEIVPADIDGQTMPNTTFAPKSGDKYAVFKCMLPTAYICDNATKTGASWDMFRAAVKHLFDNEDLKFTFTGELDGIWSKKDWVNIGGRIKLGGYIRFSDDQFQKDGVLVRITGIKDYINKPHSPVIELSNTTVSGSVSSTLNDLKSEEVIVDDLHRDAIQFTKRRFRDAKETISMLEEALLDNFTNSINPIAVQTMSMLVGDESLQFRFVNSKTSPVPVTHRIVYDNETKQLTAEAGIIQHMTLGINTVSASHKVSEYKFWDMTAYTSAVLDDGKKKYYLYAKVSKTAQTGVFILSENAIKLEGVSGFYHLLVGVLNSEYNEERSFVTLYGFTEILPGRITTDKIVSTDGNTYFDLLKGIISGQIKFKSGSSGLYELDEWEAVNGLITQAQNTANAAVESAKNANIAVGDLNDYVDGAFADGIITEAEAKAIEKYINTVNNTKAAVEAAYNKLYTNAYLTGTAKTGLMNAKITLMGSIENLISAINSAIADGRTTVTEKNNVDNKYATFNSAYADFNTAVEAANKAIQDTLKGYSDSVLNTANAAVESAKNAIAKDLGYANFDDLAKKAAANETIIVGGKINTTLINAELIVTAALLAKLVKVTELVAEHLTVTGSSKIAGFSVSGNGLTNTPFNNDAYVIFRNDAHKCFAGIGGNVLPTSSGLRAVARFENEDTSDWWGLNRNIATLFSAKNGRYNHAFLGSGNGNLDGWIGGYRYSKYNLTSANTIYSGYSNLKDNNRWVIYSSVDNSGITLPKLSEVRDALSIGSSTKFCVEFTIIADLDSKDFDIYGRNSKKSSDNTYPWNTSEYPNLVHWDNDHWDSLAMGAGDSLTVLLIYDSSKGGSKGGYPLTYTARVINRQN
ncbi:MAG: Prophage endopeptidase tail [Bacteriophage sp.]|nr:MAG: Prophage endopeptidase tail [Bacteriophage sp.]UWG71807.1 MAG: Prophage endopeptidase tail [Bacteriophage sp.]